MSRFLIVDDSSFIQKQLKEFLESKGHEIVGIGNDGNEGEELFKEHKPDLVTLDITMPNRSGKDCLKAILDHDPEARCIMVSAIREEEMVMDCLQLGAKAYINKPLKFKNEDYCEEFLSTIEEAFEE